MSTDIGVVKGVIELQDEFTSQLGLASAALSQFSKENQESLIAVAGAVGLVTAALGAAGAAVYNLGQRGADVADLEATMEHFSGSAQAAHENLDALRKGVLGTVEDFDLLKQSSHLLSAGVQLTAEDFGTLGSAAFVLQNRGLGGTKEMLDLVSNAMVTGRTRALAMALGVVDAGDDEADYAKKLGITKDQLSATGQAEAKRIAIMAMLNTAVKDAGVQQRDFGEKIEFAKAAMANWVDELAKAVSTSPALAAGMDAIQVAIASAFGGDSATAIESIMELIKKGAILAVDFGLGAIEMARVVNTAWSFVKSIILGTMTVMTGAADLVVEQMVMISTAAEKVHLVPEGTTAALTDVRTSLRAMTSDLADQTREAIDATNGGGKFNAQLDTLGGTLFTVRDAIDGATASTKKNAEAVDIAAKNTATLAKMAADHTALMIDHQKVEDAAWAIEKKSLAETTELWSAYFANRVHNTGTATDAARADILKWRDDEVAKLDASDKNWQFHYDAIAAMADQKLGMVGSNWNELAGKSQQALQQAADAAVADYDRMISSGLTFGRDVLDAQVAKIHETQDAVRGMGASMVQAYTDATAAAKKHNDEIMKISDQNKKLSDPVTQTYNTPEEVMAANLPPAIQASLLAALAAKNNKTTAPTPPTTRNFEPPKTNFPTTTLPSGGGGGVSAGGGSQVIQFYVNGTGDEIVKKVKDALVKDAKLRRQV